MDKKTIMSLGNEIRNDIRKDETEAFSKLTDLMNNGNIDATIELGNLCVENQFSEDDYIKTAIELYQLAVIRGSIEAINLTGVVCFQIGEYQSAYEMFELAIEENNLSAVTNLGKMYSEGLGVEQDYSKAVSLYKKAAELGENDAMFCLGECYYEGLGVEKDIVKEIEWFTKAAESGNIEACLRLEKLYKRGWGVEKNIDEAIKWYRKAIDYYEADAKLGSIYAVKQIAEIYYEKLEDVDRGIEWYEKAAELGDGDAAFSLSQIYCQEMNDGDNEIKWLEKAYQLGNMDGLSFLGDAYKCRHDFDKAKECFEKLAKSEGYEVEGIVELGKMYEEIGEYNEAKKYYEKLVESGNHEGMSALGGMYAKGKGVKVDIEQAAKWYKKAFEAGDYSAEYKMKELTIIEIIIKNTGILQTDMYKKFSSQEKDNITSTLKFLDKEKRIIRVKSGSTYKLFTE